MFFRKKRLIDYDPAKLNLEMLSTLQGSLVAKLIIVNEELRRRWQSVADLSEDLPNSGASRAVLASGAARLERFNAFLETELAEITRPVAGAGT